MPDTDRLLAAIDARNRMNWKRLLSRPNLFDVWRLTGSFRAAVGYTIRRSRLPQ